jgi:hypothetical protein
MTSSKECSSRDSNDKLQLHEEFTAYFEGYSPLDSEHPASYMHEVYQRGHNFKRRTKEKTILFGV